MSIEALAPWLLLAASFATGLSGLLIHAQTPQDIAQPASKPGEAPMKYRRFANALFVLSVSMLGWAGLWLLGPQTSKFAGSTGHALHTVLFAAIAIFAAFAKYWQRRDGKRKRDER